MLKKLIVLVGMLAMLLVVAAPAMAQADKEHSGTGLLPEQPYNASGEADSLYTLTDEATGISYELYSGFAELEDFAGQRVYFEGLQQGPPTQGPIQVNVTYIEPVGTEGIETNAEVSGVISPNPDALVPGGEPTSHLITEDGTGDVYEISSYTQGVDLSQHEEQFVTIYGIFQTHGNPLSSFDDPSEVPIAVTEVYSDYDPAPEAEVTGRIQPVAEPMAEGPTHTITETGTGDVYDLWSDAVDLTQYEGTQSTIYGVFQTLGSPLSSFEDPTDVLIAVNEVELISETSSDETSAEDQYQGVGTTTGGGTRGRSVSGCGHHHGGAGGSR